jgi:GntR family transcriptional repressor for pyruvate dehydrogenase complex
MSHVSTRTLSANATVVMALKQAISDGTYPPGALLPAEEELVRRIGVSRVPLREGIKQLEAMGWLRIERGTGTRVTPPDFSVIEPTVEFLARFEVLRFGHVHQLRRIVEVEVAADLARNHPVDLVQRLRAANGEIASDTAKPEGYVDADLRFHDLLLDASPNPLFPRLMAGFRKYMTLSRRLSFSGPEAVLETVRAHEAVIAAIERGDADGARAAMLDHLTVTAAQLGIDGAPKPT